VTSTGSNDRGPDWILKSQLNDWVEIYSVASFCEWFLHIYRRYLLLLIDLIAWIHSICINSVEFLNSFDILKAYDVIPCVCPLIDHGSRPMKSHEFLRLLYIYIYIYYDKTTLSRRHTIFRPYTGQNWCYLDKGNTTVLVILCYLHIVVPCL
jgi:hypothetical protein